MGFLDKTRLAKGKTPLMRHDDVVVNRDSMARLASLIWRVGALSASLGLNLPPRKVMGQDVAIGVQFQSPLEDFTRIVRHCFYRKALRQDM